MDAETDLVCEDENGGHLQTNALMEEAHPAGHDDKNETVGNTCAEKRKKRRGKSKRKVMKPYVKIPAHDCKNKYCGKNANKNNRNNEDNTQPQGKSRAPYNNNQFLMEVHMPESENIFHPRTPPARTRNSSFSVDSDENYFYSLPEDEEDFLTREFSSVYEDAQSERLTTMSKAELIQEYLDLENKFETLSKRCGIKSNTNPFGSGTDADVAEKRTLDKLLTKIRAQELEIKKLRAKNAYLCKSRNLDSSLCDCSSGSISSSNNSVALQNYSKDGHSLSETVISDLTIASENCSYVNINTDTPIIIVDSLNKSKPDEHYSDGKK